MPTSPLSGVAEIIASTGSFRALSELAEHCAQGEEATISGLSGSLLAFAAAHLFSRQERQIALLVADADHAQRLHDDCSLLVDPASVHLAVHARHHEGTLLDMTAPVAQVEALRALTAEPQLILVASAEGMIAPLPPPASFTQRTIVLRSGERHPFEPLLQRLTELGFDRKDFVETYGDLAVRGGILDVFPFAGEHPIRLEFWGDTIESIREFDPLSQRSIRRLDAATIVASFDSSGLRESPNQASLTDYLKSDCLILVDEPASIEQQIGLLEQEGVTGILPWRDLRRRLRSFRNIIHSTLVPFAGCAIRFDARPQPLVSGSVRLLLDHLRTLSHSGIGTLITCDSAEEEERIRELIEEELTSPPLPADATVRPAGSATGDAAAGSILSGEEIRFETLSSSLHSGFIFPEARLAVLTEHEIFGRLRRRGVSRRRGFRGISAKEFRQLRRGDFVVHQDYGIGRFEGLQKLTVSGAEQEVMRLVYDENGVVYVNLNFINRVQKYASQEGHVPKLSRLGTPHWERLKERAKKRIKDIARELIQLYARRKHEPGFAFDPDTHWQKEMEASFMYEDTADQARATLDVKADMETSAPMDRLICGDVGFGKTEVAVRAAFKAVTNGKQAAVLVPTTILAQQHFNTFADRLGRYAVRVAHLSRFTPAGHRRETLEQLKRGGIDILIGTHRMLSKDVQFKNLGLLVIDEEHRFGVTAKEALRRLRATVDTLTLTATPIPRTLQFSLLGARDLSIINTPPRNRLPIITEIVRFDLKLVREVILRELQRGGQVYFIHDRVHDIDTYRALLEEHIPEARIHVAHGQMPGHELEKTMLAFLERKYDVLVCTKIIESGIDIPSVNTILINRADRFGMAELYQLRGRVGRSNVQAYAYFITPPLAALPRPTLRRLQSIQEFTELGSGFNLAMRDLEIRGAGNLLGAEQSGFILEMGFETYQRVVEEAVRELKEQEFGELFERELAAASARKTETVVETDLPALIPDFYVESDAERLDLYRRLYRLERAEEVEALRQELTDRFGEFPDEVGHLLGIVELKIAAAQAGVTKVDLRGQRLILTLPASGEKWFYEGDGETPAPFQRMAERIQAMQHARPRFQQAGTVLRLQSVFGGLEPAERLRTARAMMVELLS